MVEVDVVVVVVVTVVVVVVSHVILEHSTESDPLPHCELESSVIPSQNP